MKLKRFDGKIENEKRRVSITFVVVAVLISLITGFAISSYALYKSEDSKTIVDTKVGSFSNEDVTIAILQDGVSVSNIPKKGVGYIFEYGECTNGAVLEWNNDYWEAVVDFNVPTACTVSFVTEEYVNGLKPYMTLDKSGANEPKLDNGLIPIIWNSATSKWKYADTTKGWYNYRNWNWANAVTLISSARSNYSVGDDIEMEDINTMWVWVPKYEYRIRGTYGKRGTWSSSPGEIEVKFVSKDRTVATEEYQIHPAFTFGEEKLSGIWVGKFELGTNDSECLSNFGNCDKLQAPIIKPLVKPWTYAKVGTFWTSIKNNMNDTTGTTTYGIHDSDVHMMKNTEWGAVAYLSQSKYGKYGNTNYTGAEKQVYINNYSSLQTGCSAGAPSTSSSSRCTHTYNVEKNGTGSSTSGTIYGVYDMSGGVWEYVMGIQAVNNSQNNIPAVGQSGWNGYYHDNSPATEGIYGDISVVDRKYYDLYDYKSSYSDYSRAIPGDATAETEGWYSDQVYFVNDSNIFFKRGGKFDESNTAGVFNFNYGNGNLTVHSSSRAVLV